DAAAVGNQRQQGLGQQVRALEVDPVHLVQLRLGGLGEGHVQAGAGVVDQVLELLPAPAGQHLAHAGGEGREAAAVGHVQRQHRDPAPGRLQLGGGGFGLGGLAAVGEDQVVAGAGQVGGGVAAEAAAAAGDQGDGGDRGIHCEAPCVGRNGTRTGY